MTRSAIVTGGAGFIGSHVVDSLLADGYRVVAVDDLSTGRERNLDPAADLELIDIADVVPLDMLFDRVRPERVFHLGAQSMVTVSVKDPQRDCEVNVRGTLNVLEAAGRHAAPVVFTSTGGALYGDGVPLPTPETQIPAPLSPYGASKWAGESYVRTWALKSGVPHAVCRLGNVYGPRQSPHGEAGVVSIFSRMLWEGRAPQLYGYGDATRDYVHVHDVVACLRAASGTRGVFNVATAVETSVRQVFEFLRGESGSQVEPVLMPLREGELTRSCMDPREAERVLGWSARVPVEAGMRRTYRELIAEFEAEGVPACR
jgi:UDP-glucose 4-epimerase